MYSYIYFVLPGGQYFLRKNVGHDLKPINNLFIAFFLSSLKSLWLPAKISLFDIRFLAVNVSLNGLPRGPKTVLFYFPSQRETQTLKHGICFGI